MKKPSDSTNAKVLFKGARFEVQEIAAHKQDGKILHRQAVIHPGAVVILPLDSAKTVVMIRNERYVVGETLWELPAGTLEPGEPPESTAYRELIEETGFKASSIKPLTKFYTTPGFCNEIMYAYVAEGLEFVGQDLDETEEIIVEKVSWDNVLEMVRSGEICDGKTIATLLYYTKFYR